MFTEAFTQVNSPIHRCDARVRIVVAVAWSITVALSQDLRAQLVCGGVALAAALVARLPLRDTLLRLLPLNVFIAALFVLLPLTSPGAAAFHLGAITISWTGLLQALGIGVRANAIVLTVTALVATLDIVAFGRALHALRVPPKLVTLLLFTVRYVTVLRAEYHSLRRAMRMRCFRPGTNAHTLQSIGYLAGMLLVRGIERSERVLMAMKCRGYTGTFPIADLRALRLRDGVLGVASAACIALVAWAERQ